MIAELRYLGISLIVFVAIAVPMAVALGIVAHAHLGPGRTTIVFSSWKAAPWSDTCSF